MVSPSRALVLASLLALLWPRPVPAAESESEGAAGTEAAGEIAFEIRGARSDNGHVHVSLFAKPDGFPSMRQKAIRIEVVPITDGVAVGSFEDVAYRKYAISAFHDENGNDELEINFFGMPKEGVGASNDPKSRFGPPGWTDAAFELAEPQFNAQITMRYPGS